MLFALEIVVLAVAVAILAPMAVLVTECLVAMLPGRRRPDDGPRPRCAILVPAHDEESGIAATLESIRPQLGPDDQLLVVADNCSDQTALVARGCGATVVQRTDPERRGKGFALDFGVRQLEQAPPEVLLILDADCRLQDGTIATLARRAATTGRPVQAVYLMAPPSGNAGTKEQLSAFAFQFKNQVRPLGLYRLGMPCLLTGTGMALPWPVVQRAELATGNIVEDMKLGIDLAVAGKPPQLCAEALVTSELPTTRTGAVKQRSRWEHGHVQTMLVQVPRLLRAALAQFRLDLLGLALELSVPPLSMLFLLWGAALLAALALWFFAGSPSPALLLLGGALAVMLAILGSWARFGRERLPLTTLLAAPFYIMWKVPIYLAMFIRPQKAWVRADRTAPVLEKDKGPG